MIKMSNSRNGFNADADKKIIEDAISFYFMDADAPDGKVWLYMDAMDDK